MMNPKTGEFLSLTTLENKLFSDALNIIDFCAKTIVGIEIKSTNDANNDAIAGLKDRFHQSQLS
jgi:hypothetical protein